MNYQNNVIYQIKCKDENIEYVYVGHTTNYYKRYISHKYFACDGKGTNKNCYVYKFIKENGGWNNWEMLELEKYPCQNILQAKERERYWYEILNSKLNVRSPFKRIIPNNIRCKEWRQNNGKYICECGSSVSINNKNRHIHTPKHQKLINQIHLD